MGCSIYNGYIYCVGHYSGNLRPFPSTAWNATPVYYPMPLYMTGNAASATNSILSSNTIKIPENSIGLNSTVNLNYTPPYFYPSSAYYAAVNSSGIGQWHNTTQYPIPLTDAYCEIAGSGGGYFGGGGPN